MDRSLGEFEQVLLFALVELDDESDGAAIRRHIEKRAGRIVSPGAVYVAMDRMEARGLVTSRVETTPPELGGRRKKYYRLEPAGARALDRSHRLLTAMARGLSGRLAALASGGRRGKR
jgi:DNA-binding PadR family transcriptional regulator